VSAVPVEHPATSATRDTATTRIPTATFTGGPPGRASGRSGGAAGHWVVKTTSARGRPPRPEGVPCGDILRTATVLVRRAPQSRQPDCADMLPRLADVSMTKGGAASDFDTRCAPVGMRFDRPSRALPNPIHPTARAGNVGDPCCIKAPHTRSIRTWDVTMSHPAVPAQEGQTPSSSTRTYSLDHTAGRPEFRPALPRDVCGATKGLPRDLSKHHSWPNDPGGSEPAHGEPE
jgi:hypothetical protein